MAERGKGKWVRRSQGEWRGVLSRFERSGLAVTVNVLVAQIAATDTWVDFKLFAPYPLLMVFLAVLAARLRAVQNAA